MGRGPLIFCMRFPTVSGIPTSLLHSFWSRHRHRHLPFGSGLWFLGLRWAALGLFLQALKDTTMSEEHGLGVAELPTRDGFCNRLHDGHVELLFRLLGRLLFDFGLELVHGPDELLLDIGRPVVEV